MLAQGPESDLNPQQLLVAIVIAVVMLVVVIELVRKRKLREEYAFLWICTAILLTILALWTDVLGWFGDLLGAKTHASTLFFGAIVFLMLVALQFSIRLTKLTFRNKSLSQQVAILTKEVEDLKQAQQQAPQQAPQQAKAPEAGDSAPEEIAAHKSNEVQP